MSGTVRNFINKITPLYYCHAPPSTSSHECPLRSPRTQPVLASRPLLVKHNSCLMMCTERGIECLIPRKTAVLSLQPKLKACRVRLPNKHSHKLNTSNLQVHTLIVYQYIAHKRISLLYSSHVILPISPPSVYLIWLRTRIIGNISP